MLAPRGAKGRLPQLPGCPMSRKMLIILLLLLAIVAGAIYLSTVDTEVPPQRIEQDVTNEALAG